MTPNFIGNIQATSDKADAEHDVKYSQLKFQLLMSPRYIGNIDAASDKADADHGIKHKPLSPLSMTPS